MYSYLYLYLLTYRTHVGVSFGFPEGISFLGNPVPVPHPVDTFSLLRDVQGCPVPHLRLSLDLEPYSSAGFIERASGSVLKTPGSYPVPFWSSR